MTKSLCRICRGEGCATCAQTGLITPRDLLNRRGKQSQVVKVSVGAMPRFMGTMRVFNGLPRGSYWRERK